MADAFLKQYGGSGADSSDCTAKKSQVLSGVTAITSDSNDEAEAGTMPERGKLNRTLAAGQSVTLSEGHYTGGTVSAQSLASQTGGATAEDRYVKKGLTYWKDGVLHTGTMETQSAISFSAAARSHDTIRISWKNPTKGPWEGIRIQMSTSGIPGASGGTRVYTGAGNNPGQANGNNYVDITGLQPLTKYYFSCTSYCTGLDDGTRADVDATTTRVYLYNRGVNNVEFSVSDDYTHTGTISLGSNAIIYGTRLSMATFVSALSVDLSKYSKMVVKFKATDGQYSYFSFSTFGKPSGAYTLLGDGGVNRTGSEQTLEIALRSSAKTFNDKIYIQARSSNSATGSTVGGIQCEIYEIWLE